MRFWPHPRNVNHYSTASIDQWLGMQQKAGLEPTYSWRAESGMVSQLRTVLQKLKAVNGTLCVLISPDTHPEYQGSPLAVPMTDDDWWVSYYTNVYAPIIAASGVKVGLFHHDKEDWKTQANWSSSVFREAVRSRQSFYESLASKLLPPGHPPVPSVWYGQNWVIPNISPTGQLTGSHPFARLPDDASRVSNYVNMYWPHIEASMRALLQTFAYSSTPSGRYVPEMTVIHHWCGVVKNWKLGKDSLTPAGFPLGAHKFWGSFYRQMGVEHVVVYASTDPVLTPDQYKVGDVAYANETEVLFSGASKAEIPSLDSVPVV